MEDRLEVLEVDARDEGSIERAAGRVRDMGGGEARVRAVVNASGVVRIFSRSFVATGCRRRGFDQGTGSSTPTNP